MMIGQVFNNVYTRANFSLSPRSKQSSLDVKLKVENNKNGEFNVTLSFVVE